ncbi:MAG: hypothetical protein AAF974_08415, partial [Cyanobacteria bacterium P01_E01_bin.34]
VDGGYRGPALADWVMRQGPWCLEVVMRSPEEKGFKLLPQRWVVERTFGITNLKPVVPRHGFIWLLSAS